jgi:hypothetical protein
MAAPLSLACISQIPGTENKMSYLLALLGPLLADKTANIVHVAASSSGSIPAGATAYSISVTGANATVGGVAVATGDVITGTGPLATALAYTTGLTTTLTVSYETVAASDENP